MYNRKTDKPEKFNGFFSRQYKMVKSLYSDKELPILVLSIRKKKVYL